MGNFIDMAGRTGKDVMMPQLFIQDCGSISKYSFLLAYRRAFKTDRIASLMSAAQVYDGMHLLAMVMRQASSTNGAQIRLARLPLTTYAAASVRHVFRLLQSK